MIVPSLALAVFAAAPVIAQAGDDGEVYVYTNADLERLAPIATQDTPIVSDELGWQFVFQALDRGYGRLDADRNHELTRQQIANEEARLDRESQRRRYGLARAPYAWGYYGYGGDNDHHPDRGLPGTDYANRIVPLHARPNVAELRMRVDGSRSGADAFPGGPAYDRSTSRALPGRGGRPKPTPYATSSRGGRSGGGHAARGRSVQGRAGSAGNRAGGRSGGRSGGGRGGSRR